MAIERIVPDTKAWNAYYANHICRYRFAVEKLSVAGSRKILDAACGVGYGSAYLADLITGSSITAIDRSESALQIARQSFAKTAVSYLTDDCLTFTHTASKGPFDAVVSFETLEHLPDPVKFLQNCREHLREKGLLIISTPNQLVSSPGNDLNWEFHEKEYTPEEFMELLEESGFRNIRLYGQQLNLKGKIKDEIRSDLNRLWSNPFVRLGRWIQAVFRGQRFDFPLNESIDDFEIPCYGHPSDISKLEREGPFVLIAVAEK
jgi:SAM-dependent methyltransferase